MLEGDRYVLDSELNVWRLPDEIGFAAGPDDDTGLSRIERLIREASDVGCDSEELAAAVSDWLTRYHLSPQRLNILRPLSSLLLGRILEIGCECGAITRFLGETGSPVVAIEKNLRKASIAAARCRGLENVRVACDAIDSFVATDRFDSIVVVGSPEEGRTSGQTQDLRSILQRCGSLLQPAGVLLLAIENGFGLKYFAGTAEDHSGRVFGNILGSAKSGTTGMPGRREIEDALRRSGFKWWEFLYPFPDHRLAGLIVHPDAFLEANKFVRDMIRYYVASYDEQWRSINLFSERMAWELALRNDLAKELANSFVILASRDKPAKPRIDSRTLAYSYAVMRRRCYQKSNLVVRTGGKLVVRRAHLHDSAPRDGAKYRQALEHEAFVPGRIYANELYDLLDRPGWNFQGVMNWFRPYYEFLVSHASVSEPANKLLPANFVDCTPFNIVRQADGRFVPFDLEWVAQSPVPLKFVLFRGLLYCLNSSVAVGNPGEELDLGVLNLTTRMIREAGETLDEGEIEELFCQEDDQQVCVVGGHAKLSREYWRTTRLTPRPANIAEVARRRENEIARLSADMASRQDDIERLTSLKLAYAQMLADRDQQIGALVGGLASRDREVQRLTDETAACRHTIGSLESRIAELSELRSAVAKQDDLIAALNARSSAREEHVAELNTALSALRSTLGERNAEILEMAGRIARHDVELARSTAQASGLREMLVDRDSHIASLSGRIDELKSTIDRLHEQIVERERQSAEFIAAATASSVELTRLQAQSAGLRDMLVDRDSQLGSLAARCDALQKALTDRDTTVSALTSVIGARDDEIARLERQIGEYRQAAAERDRRIAALENWVAARDQENVRLHQTIDALYASIAERDRLMGSLRDAVAGREAAMKEFASELERARERIEELGAEAKGATERAEDLRIRMEAKERRVHELETIAAEREKQVAGLERTVSEAVSEKDRLNETIAGLQRDVRARDTTISDLNQNVAGERKRANVLAGEVAKVRTAAAAREREVLELDLLVRERDRQLGGLRGEIAQIQADFIWNLAKPLRRAWRAATPAVARMLGLLLTARYALSALPAPGAVKEKRKALRSIAASGCFDSQFYVRKYQHVGAMRMSPLVHYVMRGAQQCLNPNPLFDAAYYLERNPEARSRNALAHYIDEGTRLGRAPHPLFDTGYYLKNNPDVAAAAVHPLAHYLAHGGAEARRPHLLFDSAFYLQKNPDVAKSGFDPLVHYLEHGAREGRNPHPLFSTSYYLKNNRDVAAAGINPLVHFVTDGAAEGRDPHPLFDTDFYRRNNPEAATSESNPLAHYLSEGDRQGRSPHPLFDCEFYRQRNSGALAPEEASLVHYLNHGAAEGRWPNPWFDPKWYVAQYPEVGQSGLDPLVHYLLRGASEGKNPHPLFDTSWYLSAYPDVAAEGFNPLAHYLQYGAREGRATQRPPDISVPMATAEVAGGDSNPAIETIKPFFDVRFYLKQCPDIAQSGADPYQHYLTCGAREGKDPHPLFDTSFYLETNPDVARDNLNPLVHFALYGGAEGRDPHPLFHAGYYLRSYPDVAKAGINPLLHYITAGYKEGRFPNPMFDSGYYLRSNPDVAGAQAIPLVHFIEWGVGEGRKPHPTFDVRLYMEHHPDLAKSGINPLADYFGRAARPAEPTPAPPPAILRSGDRFQVEALSLRAPAEPIKRGRRTILCVSHVPPYPPRAGNEYGEYRQLDYLERHGYGIVLVLSPLPGEEISPSSYRALCERFPYTILCGRDGLVQHPFRDGPLELDRLHGTKPQPLGPEIGEHLVTEPHEQSLVETERVFCHDFLARLALHLEAALSPCIVLSQYIFQTRFLPLIRTRSLKVIQTHDMFSTKQRKVIQFGVEDSLSLTPDQERQRLLRADLILSCQRAEAQEFSELVPERRVLEIPLDFDVVERMPPPDDAKILYVASDNALNTKGLRDFLRLAWPLILREVPEAQFLVAGKVCRTIANPPENVRLLGLVDDLEPLYEQAKVTINPSVAGTGLKIKTAESLSRLRPVVSWPSGVDGFQPELAAMCHTARDWPAFAAHVVSILRSPAQNWFSAEQQARIRHLLAPDTIYRPLLKCLDAYSERHKLQPYYRATAAKRGGR